MKNLSFLWAFVGGISILACQTTSKVTLSNQDQLNTEILQAETNLLSFLRNGELMKGVAIHWNSPDYRNIWNGEIKTYEMLYSRIKAGMEKGLESIDYHVQSRDFKWIDQNNVLETLTATETTSMKNGVMVTSGLTAISILWQKIGKEWRLSYLHASELPKD